MGSGSTVVSPFSLEGLFSNAKLESMMYTAERSHTFEDFSELSGRFEGFHQNGTNLFLHLITTPLGFVGVASLMRYFTDGSTSFLVLCILYMLR